MRASQQHDTGNCVHKITENPNGSHLANNSECPELKKFLDSRIPQSQNQITKNPRSQNNNKKTAPKIHKPHPSTDIVELANEIRLLNEVCDIKKKEYGNFALL